MDPSSANLSIENENMGAPDAPDKLIDSTESSQYIPGSTSDDDGPVRSTKEDVGQQEQPAVLTTPQAIAESPYHVFGRRTKWTVVAIIGVAGTLSGLSSNIYFPSLRAITKEFASTHQVTSLTITSYQLIQGVAPIIWGTLSDKLGRRQVYGYSIAVYIVANVVLAFTPNMPVLFAFRGLQAFGSASVVSIGNGVIQDIALAAERGGFMSNYQSLRMFSIAIGPVIGGALSHKWGFRSIFVALAVLSSSTLILIIAFLPETLRSLAGNGSVRLSGIKYKPLWNVTARDESTLTEAGEDGVKTKIKLQDFLDPFRMLAEVDTLLNLLFGAVVYSVWSMMTCTTTMLFSETYGLTELHIGFAFLPNGIGTCAASVLAGWLMDRDFKSAEAKYKTAHGMPQDHRISPKQIPSDFPIEEARFRHVFWITAVLAVSTALYSAAFWDHPMTARLKWMAVPLTLQFFIAATSNMIFAINSTMITDLHPGKGAGATAINNLARCTMSAGAVPLVNYLIKRFSTLQTFCSLSLVVILCIPLAAISKTRGKKWREERMRQVELSCLESSV